MSIYLIRLALLLVAAFFFNACILGKSTEKHAQGTDNPNSIAGTVYFEEEFVNTGLVYMMRGVYAPDTQATQPAKNYPMLASTSTDAKGKFKLEWNKSALADWLREAESSGDSSVFFQFYQSDSNSILISPTVKFSELERLNGKEWDLLPANKMAGKILTSISGDTLTIPGTPFFAELDSLGSFYFSSLPDGDYQIIPRNTALKPHHFEQLRIRLGIQSDSVYRIINLLSDSLMLFDFENDYSQNLLKGQLFDASDINAGKLTSEMPITVEDFGGPTGRSLSVVTGAPYLMPFGKGYYNLSKLKGISFYAKGPGKLAIRAATQAISTPEPAVFTEVTLSSQWERYFVFPEDLKQPEPNGSSTSRGLTWSDVNTQVERISFQIQDAESCLIDEVHLLGVTVEDLKKAP